MNEDWKIQGSEAWLKKRRDYVTATDACAIMGVSPWKTRYQCWLEKQGLWSQTENEAMKRGKDLEEKIRQEMSYIHHCYYQPNVLISEKYPFMMASVDGIHESIIEIKCGNKEDHEKAKKYHEVPEKYYPQIQHILSVSEKDWMYYVSYYDSDLVYFSVDKDEKYIEKMLIEEQKFYDQMVNFIEPELTEKDYITRNDEDWKVTTDRYRLVEGRIKSLEEEKNDLRRILIDMSQGKATTGNGVKLSPHVRKGNIDYSSVPFPEHINLENYRKPSQTYFRIMI